MTQIARILRVSATGSALQGKTSTIDTEKRSIIRENNVPILKAIIREIRVIRIIRDSDACFYESEVRIYAGDNPRFRRINGYPKKMNDNLKHKDITHKIIGAAFEVHKYFGNGFQELIYQRALAIEMREVGLEFAREIEQDIFYKDFPKPIGTRRVDFIVAGKVLVELKAVTELADVHKAQLLNYLKVYRLEVGLLINFGEKSLKYKRLILSQSKRRIHN